ncbi:MAG: hypothetical protein NVS1B4_21800 [Gemmatimonadaceae bacterium]
MRVAGSRTAYVKYGLDIQEDALRRGIRPDAVGWGEETAERWGVLGAGDATHAIRTEPGAYPQFYAGVHAALRHGAPPPVDPRSALAALEVIEAARLSADQGQTVTLRNPET